MTLYTFNRTGLLSKETTYLLRNLEKKENWDYAKLQLYNSGFIPSESRNEEIFRELKNRFDLEYKYLPTLNLISKIAKSNLSSLVKSEIYFVYLINSTEIVSIILKKVYEVYDDNKKNPIITRKTIESLIKIYLKRIKIKQNEKTIQNWIGKFISTLKETRIFLTKRRSEFIMNVGGLEPETWAFFLMDSHFRGYPFEKAFFKEVFHISNVNITSIIQRSNKFEWIDYSIQEYDNQNISFEYHPRYSNVLEWIKEFDD